MHLDELEVFHVRREQEPARCLAKDLREVHPRELAHLTHVVLKLGPPRTADDADSIADPYQLDL
jgi:hypothetical protein